MVGLCYCGWDEFDSDVLDGATLMMWELIFDVWESFVFLGWRRCWVDDGSFDVATLVLRL